MAPRQVAATKEKLSSAAFKASAGDRKGIGNFVLKIPIYDIPISKITMMAALAPTI